MARPEDMSPSELAAIIDHTFLKPYGPPTDVENLCAEARRYGFGMVAVNPAEVQRCVELLAGCITRVGAAVGFPLGQNTPAVKQFEAADAIERGAQQIDMVINVRALHAGETDILREEIAGVVGRCREAEATSKVILETGYLTDDQKRTVCRIAGGEGADFVKTSTGFGTGGATVEDIRLMREAVGPEMGVKAAGGIRDLQAVYAMLHAGADRIGTSSSVAIMRELMGDGGGS